MWWIYALGGGWGHLTRAVALARIARRDREVRVLTNSPYASMAAGEADLVLLDPSASPMATRLAAVRAIAESPPEWLIVDTFPRGIGGELADLLGKIRARKALVNRDLNPRYVASASLRDFVARHYDLVLAPGEDSPFGDLPAAQKTAPWLVRSADQIPPRRAVRDALRLTVSEDPCLLVCAAGKREELAWYGAVTAALAGNVTVRCLAAERPPGCPEGLWVRYWPAVDLMGCAWAVVGGAGYNTINECRAWGIPLIARLWPRAYDRQAERAAKAGIAVVNTPEEAARAALTLPPRRTRAGGISQRR